MSHLTILVTALCHAGIYSGTPVFRARNRNKINSDNSQDNLSLVNRNTDINKSIIGHYSMHHVSRILIQIAIRVLLALSNSCLFIGNNKVFDHVRELWYLES